MSQPVKLRSPNYRVVLGDIDDPSTWTELTVQAITPDLARAEASFTRHKDWGKPADATILLTSVSAYYALIRTKQIEGPWEAFEEQLIEVSEAGDDDVVDPTQPGPEAG